MWVMLLQTLAMFSMLCCSCHGRHLNTYAVTPMAAASGQSGTMAWALTSSSLKSDDDARPGHCGSPAPALATAARQVMGNDLDGTGGVNTSATNQSYIAFRIPGAVYAPRQRTLLVYAEARKYSQDDWGGQHDLTLRRSTDDGASFGALLTVVDAAETWPERCPSPTHNCSAVWDPSAVVDRVSGQVTVFFSRTQSVWGISSHRDSLWTVTSRDGFESWSKPVDVSSSCHRCAPIGHPYPHRSIACTTPGGGHGIQTTQGRLIVPLYSESVVMGTGICYSDDMVTWHFGAHPMLPAGIGALGALEPEVVELFDEDARPPPVQPNPHSQCQAELDSFCNNRTANKECIDSTLRAHPDAAPFVALYGLGTGDHGAREWRCYSHLALDKTQRKWDINSSLPHAYCTHPTAADGSNALADIRATCMPPPPPKSNSSITLMLTLRRAFGSDGAPEVWCGNGVQNCRAQAYSHTNGDSWVGYAAQPNLPDPGVKAGLFRFEPPPGSKSYTLLTHLASVNASVASAPPGALLFVNPSPKLGTSWTDRIRTTLRLSLDNGRSWPFAVQIDARGGYSTISATSDPDIVAVIFEDTYGTQTSRPFPAACSKYPSPKGICDGGVLISRVNVLELMSQGAWAAPVAQPCKLDDAEVERTTLLPSFTWESLSTFCFPGGYHHGSSSCHANYTATDLLDYSRFNLVLVQGQNFTRYTNGSWRATQQAETAKFAEAMNHLPTPLPQSSSSPSPSTPRKIFPYIGFYAPAAWYEAQARFNDPQSHWEDMWLRDSQGRYGSMVGGAGSVSCSSSTEEGGNYAQYKYRRLYDWRQSSARKYFTEEVVKFILENPLIGGAFFDDVNTVADISLPCDCPNCKCECGNWTESDRADFVNGSVLVTEQLLKTFADHGKLPILSTVDGQNYGVCADQDVICNPHARSFTLRAMELLRKYGGWRFVENFGEIGTSWPSNTSSAAAILANDIKFLLSPEAKATPHLIHAHGDKSNSLDFLLAGFLIVAQENWYFSASGWWASQDPRFPEKNNCDWNDAWGERTFPYISELFDRPLGAPLGPPKEVAPLVWERNFTHAGVRFEANCPTNPRNCSHIHWHSE